LTAALTIAPTQICAFVVTDSTVQRFAYVYFEDEPGRRSAAKLLSKDEARRIAVNNRQIARTSQRLAHNFCDNFNGGVPVTVHQQPKADYFMIVTRKGQRRLWQW
jgi:hypothetical protein